MNYLFAAQCKNEELQNLQNFNMTVINAEKDSLLQNFENLSYDKNIEKYYKKLGYSLVKETTFLMGDYSDGSISEFRIELLNIFSEKEIQEKDILIKEVTWQIDKNNNLTIWYKRENKKWKPLKFFIYNKDTNF
ncbi:hypothetical protein CBG49_10625 [Capnocytophaga endodontalis]|uniref:DUF4348 domain-containing protein n=2 Tax=Capnocytophaga endodontalis TaxID=2708117 RepID=A0A1Z4BQE5_9FLAO|nr:hypothetical protein CBG49_10625 [Capnocytophaga endodontalis]